MVDGSDRVTQSSRGARPGETIAGLIFICLFAKITKEVRFILTRSGFHQPLPFSSTGYLDFGFGCDTTTDELESNYVDDAMHGVMHPFSSFVVKAVAFLVVTHGIGTETRT